MAQQTHWKRKFTYKYIGSDSLPVGKDIVLTLKEIKEEEVIGQKGEKKVCLIAYFEEQSKPMVLNKTNCKMIAKLCDSPFLEEWIGLKIQIYARKVDAWGEEVDALRVRDTLPEATKVDNADALERLRSSKKLVELQANYKTLNKALQADPEVVALKNELKGKLK